MGEGLSPTPASYALFPRPRPCLVPFQPGSGVSLSLLPRSFLSLSFSVNAEASFHPFSLDTLLPPAHSVKPWTEAPGPPGVARGPHCQGKDPAFPLREGGGIGPRRRAWRGGSLVAQKPWIFPGGVGICVSLVVLPCFCVLSVFPGQPVSVT